jgi:hypothetical protein
MSLPYGGFTTTLNPRQIFAFAPSQDIHFEPKANTAIITSSGYSNHYFISHFGQEAFEAEHSTLVLVHC